jgi:hypothetical protein
MRLLLAGLKPCPTVLWLGLDFVAVWGRMPAAEAGLGVGFGFRGLKAPAPSRGPKAKGVSG